MRFKFRCNILISGKIIKEMPGSVASETHCILHSNKAATLLWYKVFYNYKSIIFYQDLNTDVSAWRGR